MLSITCRRVAVVWLTRNGAGSNTPNIGSSIQHIMRHLLTCHFVQRDTRQAVNLGQKAIKQSRVLNEIGKQPAFRRGKLVWLFRVQLIAQCLNVHFSAICQL
ncbi:hypothetical protein ABW09_03185 [Pluralibacter gergoviae]|nr:hypothetical protein ABW09_03185 [Pluralibacter gergoviae]